MAVVQKNARVLLLTALAGLAVWRAACVLAGPDIDTDAYAHHMIARSILADPTDLAVHWVWLPLFHYVQVPLVALGGGMQALRWTNVALSAALPLVVFEYVRRTARRTEAWPSPEATAFLAALFAAASPIAMQMGTTAQPEPLFALVMLGVAIAFQERRDLWVAGLLGAAVMLRYEAWASFATVVATLAIEWILRLRRSGKDATSDRSLPRRREGRIDATSDRSLPRQREGRIDAASNRRREGHAWAIVGFPTLLILVWAALRRPVDGQWFGFLRQTHEFAAGAMHDDAFSRGLVGLAEDALYYPVLVPLRVLGPVLPLAAFGVVRTIREQGARFVLVLAACLGFISLTWIMRSSLGLDRHFVVVVALYAIFAAQGVATLAGWVARLAGRWGSAPIAARAGQTAGWLLAGVLFAGLLVELDVWMGFWKASVDRGWPDRVALGAYLRAASPDAPIYCDDATLEILSGLDRKRFDRHWVDDPHTWDLVAETAKKQGLAYVATWARKLHGHEDAGRIVFRAGQSPGVVDSGVAVMQIEPNRNRAAP